MTKKTDLRVVKTKFAIKQAFWKLLTQESLSKITIKQIINEAQVNRATLYKYYANKYDLLDQIEMDLINEFETNTEIVPNLLLKSDISQDQLKDYYNRLVQFIYKNGKKFSLLLAPNGDPAFINRLIAADKQLWHKRHLTERLAIPEHYIFSAMIGMAINLIIEWVNSDFKESPQEFCSIIEKFINPILQEIFNKN